MNRKEAQTYGKKHMGNGRPAHDGIVGADAASQRGSGYGKEVKRAQTGGLMPKKAMVACQGASTGAVVNRKRCAGGEAEGGLASRVSCVDKVVHSTAAGTKVRHKDRSVVAQRVLSTARIAETIIPAARRAVATEMEHQQYSAALVWWERERVQANGKKAINKTVYEQNSDAVFHELKHRLANGAMIRELKHRMHNAEMLNELKQTFVVANNDELLGKREEDSTITWMWSFLWSIKRVLRTSVNDIVERELAQARTRNDHCDAGVSLQRTEEARKVMYHIIDNAVEKWASSQGGQELFSSMLGVRKFVRKLVDDTEVAGESRERTVQQGPCTNICVAETTLASVGTLARTM